MRGIAYRQPVAISRQIKQTGNIIFGLALAGIGVIALIHAGSAQSRVFAVFVLLVGLGAIYLAVVAMRRRN